MARKKVCRQCEIASVYVKNESGDRRNVYVMDDNSVVARHEDESLEGYNLDTVYCLGCSWSGSPKNMKHG